jgi:hypothetical protein
MVIAPDDAVPPVRSAVARHAELVPFMVDRTGLTTMIHNDS